MFCENCGKEVPVENTLCPECGEEMPKAKKKYDMIDMKIALYEKEISIYSRNIESYFILGKAYSMKKKYEKAILIYEKVINIIPTHVIHNQRLSLGTLRRRENSGGGIMHVSENLCGELFKEFV